MFSLQHEQADYKQVGLPDGYVIILDEGDYYGYCLDTNRMTEGECPVVRWHPENQLDESYNNFYEFMLERVLDEVLDEWEDGSK